MTGAAIAGAQVRAVQRSTNQPTETTTNQDGYYTLPYLPPSTYDLEVTAAGFNKLRRENITLMVAEKLALPLKLELGSINTQVTVSADAEVVQSSDASGGLNFDSTQTSEYPLNGRQVYMLMDLTPGVLFTQEQFGASGFSGTRGWDVNGSYVVNGGVQGTNSFSLNGAPISLTGSWQLAPNADAVQEFKVQTNTYDAQIGRTGGGSVNTTLKSGSNSWHGTMFDYLRNSVLDANYTQNNQVGKPKGKHITHQFGGTVGGKIRADRDFVFFSFEGFRERVPFPVVSNVPPLDLGDGQHFSHYQWNVYDPLTVRACKQGDPGSCTSNGGYIRDPFPGNVLPQSRISPIGQKILSYYPAPNLSGLTQNFVFAGNTGQYRYDQPIGRWDHVIDQNNHLNVTVTFQHGHEYRVQTFPGPAASGNIWSQRTSQTYGANWTRILSPSAMLDVRASYGRFTSIFPDANVASGITAKDLGMNIAHAPTSTTGFPPRIQVDQFSDLFGNGGDLYTWGTDNQWNLTPTITLTRRTHTIKTGLDLVYAARGSGNIGQANGYFNFGRPVTQHYPLVGGNNTDGAGIAALLLGAPGSGYVSWNDTYYRTWPYAGVFLQDDWKVRRNLTLNLGLRYDVQFPFVERWNRVNNGFDLTAKNPVSDQVLAAWAADKAVYDATNPRIPYPDPPPVLLGGKTFVQPGGDRHTYSTDWTDIQPRFGLAWTMARDTVLRTGFAIMYRTATQGNYTDGFSQQTAYNAALDGITYNAGLTGPYSLANPFPDGIIAPSGRQLGLLTNIGNSISFDGRQRVIPRTYQYSFGIQRLMPFRVRLETKYVGSMTVHDAMAYNLDYVSLDLYQAANKNNTWFNRTLANPFYGILPKNSTYGASPTISSQNLYYPYPEFNGITVQTNPWSRYRYDGLQLQAEKRFLGNRNVAGALTVVFSYTYSKTFECNHRLNNWNLSEPCVHELSNYDKPQNIAFSGVWDIPFGKGRHWLTSPNKYLKPFIEGWTASWIYRFTSGVPVSAMNVQYLCSSVLTENQSHDHWFNNDPKCYRNLPNYTLRTIPDRFAWLRQMDNPRLDVSTSKTFPIHERWKFYLRGEATNVMNKPLCAGPDTGFQNVRFGMLPVGQQNFPRIVQLSGKILF